MQDYRKFKPIDNRDDHKCFACGPANPHGLQMKFFTDGKMVTSWLTIPEHLCGWDNLVHGGVISTVLDEIMSWTAIHLLKRIVVTRTMTVAFVKPVYVGDRLQAVGEITNLEKDKEAVVEGKLYKGDHELCARSTGHFAILKPKIAQKLGIISAEALKDIEPIMLS